MTLRNIARRIYRIAIRRLYSKSDFRLLLNITAASLERRVSAVLIASNVLGKFIRPIELRAPFGKRQLVIAPHQDDEAIGCGGAIILQRKSGASADIVFVQSGAHEGIPTTERAAFMATREAEACAAADVAGIAPPRFLRHETLDFGSLPDIVESIYEIINSLQPDVIFSPFFLDPDNDHAMCNLALALALQRYSGRCRVLGYEVWSVCIANVGVNIDPVIEQKRAMINCYRSQLTSTDYTNTTIGLNMFHCRRFGVDGCRHAEMFFDSPAEEFIRVVLQVSSTLWPEEIQAIGEANAE